MVDNDKYTQIIDLVFKTNEQSLNKIENRIDKLNQDVNLHFKVRGSELEQSVKTIEKGLQSITEAITNINGGMDDTEDKVKKVSDTFKSMRVSDYLKDKFTDREDEYISILHDIQALRRELTKLDGDYSAVANRQRAFALQQLYNYEKYVKTFPEYRVSKLSYLQDDWNKYRWHYQQDLKISAETARQLEQVNQQYLLEKKNVEELTKALEKLKNAQSEDDIVARTNLENRLKASEERLKRMRGEKEKTHSPFETLAKEGFVADTARLDRANEEYEKITEIRRLYERVKEFDFADKEQLLSSIEKKYPQVKAQEKSKQQPQSQQPSLLQQLLKVGTNRLGTKLGIGSSTLSTIGKVAVPVAVAVGAIALLVKAFNKLKDTVEKVASEYVKYARLTDEAIREQKFTYGFSGQESYAYSKTMELMGFSNFEDLYFMTSKQQQEFNERFSRYADQYEALYQSGFFDQLEETQWMLKEYQQEFNYEMLTWLNENKEAIDSILRVGMEIMNAVLQIVGFFIRGGKSATRSESAVTAKAMDILNMNTTNNKNTNIQIDNTFNGIGKADQSWLANTGEMTYESVIRALE